MHHEKWSISDINELIPWQLTVYVNLLKKQLEKENEERKKSQQSR